MEGEENVKDTEELLNHKSGAGEIDRDADQFNSAGEFKTSKYTKLSGQHHPKRIQRMANPKDRDFLSKTCQRVEKDPMWLVNIIRQSSKESHQLSRKGEDSASRSRDNYSKSSRKGFYNKSRAQHQYISSRKGSDHRVTQSQNRMIQLSQNHSKLYMNMKDLNKPKSNVKYQPLDQTMTQSYDNFQSSIQIKNYKREPLSVEREEKLNQSGYTNKYINLLDTSNHVVERKLFSDDGENSMKRDQSPLETPCNDSKDVIFLKNP